jgi:hypothetical protein
MYLHQALKQVDKEQFLEAMRKEIQDHTENKHWIVVPRATIPQGTTGLPSIWAMKIKRRISTGEVY